MPGDGSADGRASRSTLPTENRTPNSPDTTLWLDRFVSYLGFGRVAARLTPSLPLSYLYAIVTVVGWTVISAGADLFIFQKAPIYARNPYFLLQPLILIVGVHGAHSLHRSYNRAIDEMRLQERSSDPDQFVNLVPQWLPWALFAVTAGLQLIRTYADFADFTTVGIVANGFVFPFVYGPILVQFLLVYVIIEFVLPWWLYRSDVGIHFLDPHGVGGLRPLGELLKKAHYYVVAGLVVYALITYAPGVANWEISATAGAIFTGAWWPLWPSPFSCCIGSSTARNATSCGDWKPSCTRISRTHGVSGSIQSMKRRRRRSKISDTGSTT